MLSRGVQSQQTVFNSTVEALDCDALWMVISKKAGITMPYHRCAVLVQTNLRAYARVTD